MLEVNVKTLDGKNRSFCVPDDITVKQFKERITSSVDIEPESQRIIFHGRVLQDDHKLNDSDVNGKTLHVVARPPPSVRNQQATASSTTTGAGRGRPSRENSFVLGSFTLPSDVVDPTSVQDIVNQVLSGMGDIGRNARVTTRATDDGSSVDVHINLGQISSPHMHSEGSARINQARNMLESAKEILEKLENPPEESSSSSTDSDGDDSGAVRQKKSKKTKKSDKNADAATDGASSSSASNEGAADANQARRQQATPSTLADLMDDVERINRRLEPHMAQYRQMLRDDATYDSRRKGQDAQRLFNLVSEITHYIGHAYHSISDIMCDMTRPSPRTLRAPVAPQPQATAVIQQTIPIQAQINVSQFSRRGGAGRPTPATAGQTTSTPTTTTNTTTTQATTDQAAPAGQTPMETGPAYTIDSVTAEIVGNEASPPTITRTTAGNGGRTTTSTNTPPSATNTSRPRTTTTGTGGGPGQPGQPAGFPPNFLQNIIQMATSAAMRGGHPSQVFVVSHGNTIPSQTPPATTPQQAATSTTPSNRSTTTSSATTGSTTSSRSTTTGSTTRPTATTQSRGHEHAAGNQGSRPRGSFMFPGLGGMSDMAPTDMYLPCNSRHFLARRAQEAGGGRNQSPEESVSGMISNIVSSLVTQTGASVPGNQPQGTGTGTGSGTNAQRNPFRELIRQASTGNAASARPGQGTGTAPAAGSASRGSAPYVEQLRDMLSQGQRIASNSSGDSGTAGQARQQTSAAPQSGVTDETFAQLVSGIGNYVSQAAMGQQTTDTIADFLSSLGQTSNVSGDDGLVGDVYNVVTRNLTFVDLMTLFFGSAEPLTPLCQPIRQMVREKILLGGEPTDNNIASAVNRLIEDAQPDIRSTLSAAKPKEEDIDIIATVNGFLREHLRTTLRSIMHCSPDYFGENLYGRLRRMLHELLALSRSCLDGGSRSLQSLVINRAMSLTSDVNPLLRQWMSTMLTQQLDQLLQNVMVTDESVQRYIVRTTVDMAASPQSDSNQGGSPQSESSSQMDTAPDSTAAPPTSGDVEPAQTADAEMAGDGSEMVEEMNVVETAHAAISVAPQAVSPGTSAAEEMEVDPRPIINGEEVEFSSRRPNLSPRALSWVPPAPSREREDVTVVLGSEDWHSVVPPEWVPVITRDLQRQRRQPSQPPFSDAYQNGMPAKRRKLSTKVGGDTDFQNLPALVPDLIKQAASTVGVEPVSSGEQVGREAAEDSVLHAAFEREVDESVRHRLQCDTDFEPHKYPSSERYYRDKKE